MGLAYSLGNVPDQWLQLLSNMNPGLRLGSAVPHMGIADAPPYRGRGVHFLKSEVPLYMFLQEDWSVWRCRCL